MGHPSRLGSPAHENLALLLLCPRATLALAAEPDVAPVIHALLQRGGRLRRSDLKWLETGAGFLAGYWAFYLVFHAVMGV